MGRSVAEGRAGVTSKQVKSGQLELALQRYHDSECTKLLGILKGRGPVRPRIRKLLLLIIEIDLADPDRRGCFGVNVAVELSARDEAARRLVDELFDRTESYLKVAIEEGQQSGEIDAAQDSRALASFLLNSMIGLRVLSKTADGPTRLRRIVDVVMKSF